MTDAASPLMKDLAMKVFHDSKRALDSALDSYTRVGGPSDPISMRKFIMQVGFDTAALHITSIAAAMTFSKETGAMLDPDRVLFGALACAHYINDAASPPGLSTIELMALTAASFKAITGRDYDFGHPAINDEVRGTTVTKRRVVGGGYCH